MVKHVMRCGTIGSLKLRIMSGAGERMLTILSRYGLSWAVPALAALLGCPVGSAFAGDTADLSLTPHETAARIYRTPDERREAGLGRQVTDWLKVSGLAEFETAYARHHFMSGSEKVNNERPTLALQLGLELTLVEWLEAGLILDFETSGKKKISDLDEVIVGIDLEPWGFKLGRQYLPFGEFYSHFVSGPLLEFAETRADALIVDYSLLNDHLELAGYILDGDSRDSAASGFYASRDWGASVELTVANDAIRIGVGYLSDLAETDEGLLADNGNSFQKRVAAWNAYALIGFDGFELTAEMVQAARAFTEFDRDADRPFAWNIEIARFPNNALEYALRLEHSDELADQPRWQYGIATTWRIQRNFSLSLEYLRGRYKKNFARDDDDRVLNLRDWFALQLSYEF